MEGFLHTELVTPEKLHFSAEAEMVIVPGVEGEFGALPGHMPFVSVLRPGIVSVHQDARATRFFVAGGVAEVNPTSCTILAEDVIDLGTITLNDAHLRLTAAHAEYDKAIGEDAQALAERKVKIAEALVAALSETAHH